PASDAPDEDAVYVPGNWMYRAGRYRWRQGFWLDPYREWAWIPGHYVWTPAGYVFIDGYWDYTLEDRGLLFAPVYFDQPLWTTPDWCYRPYYAVTLGGLFSSLWVRPAYCHYYFGDFYDPLYAGFGFYPWCTYGPRYYDPIFGHCLWRYHRNPNWYDGLRTTHDGRVAGTLTRPARTLAQQSALVQGAKPGSSTSTSLQTVASLDQIKKVATPLITASA